MTEPRLFGPPSAHDEKLSRSLRAFESQVASAPVPDALDERVLGSVSPRTHLMRTPAFGFALGLCVASAVFFMMDRVPSQSEAIAFAPSRAAGLLGPTHVLRELSDGSVSVLDTASFISAYRAEVGLLVKEGARLRASEGGVSVLSGEVSFSVAKIRDRKRPVRVGVSGGQIEVIGTRFHVVEYGDHGFVDLHEGKIRFRDGSGVETPVLPGQRLAWSRAQAARIAQKEAAFEGRPKPPADVEPPSQQKALERNLRRLPAAPESTANAQPVQAPSPQNAEAEQSEPETPPPPDLPRLKEIQKLRSAGSYAEATRRVELWLETEPSSAMRQVLMQELSDLRLRATAAGSQEAGSGRE